MRGFAAVFRREIAERRLLALMGLLGLVPIVLPWIGSSLVPDLEALRGAAAMALANIASAVLALLLGATVLASDLGERRLGFYFSRPIGAFAIWAGKLGAAFALSVAVGLLVLAPTVLAASFSGLRSGPFEMLFSVPAAVQIPFSLAALLALVLVAHAFSVAIRARSTWLLLDVAGLTVTALLLWGALGRLRAAIAPRPYLWSLTGFLIALPLALLVASAAQVARGRTDLRRAHRVLSMALWGGLLAIALGIAGYSRWVLAATPVDLEAITAAGVAPRGDWLALSGPARHRGDYAPGFLLDTSSGRFLRIGPESLSWMYRPWYSADGSRVAWVGFEAGPGSPLDLLYADLGRPRPVPVRTAISLVRYPVIDLSPDGRQVAAVSEGRLLVYELATSRLLASAPFEYQGGRITLQFVDPRRVRLYWSELALAKGRGPTGFAWQTNIAEYDLTAGHLQVIGRLDAELGGSGWAFSPDGERLLLAVRERGARFRLVDARTGAELAEIPSQGPAVFLGDGRVAYAVRAANGWEVRLLDRSGAATAASFPFPGKELRLGGEPRPGRLVVASGGSGTPWRVFLLDLASGAAREVAQGLFPVPWYDPEGLRPAHLFSRPGGGLVWLDPETGKRRVVLEGDEVAHPS